jgi:hypothetical protein
MRGPGESYSDVILRLVELEARNHCRLYDMADLLEARDWRPTK